MQNFKLYNIAAYQFFVHDPPTDLIAITECVLAEGRKIVCFKMSVTAGLNNQKGLPSLDGNTQHMSSEKGNNAVKL